MSPVCIEPFTISEELNIDLWMDGKRLLYWSMFYLPCLYSMPIFPCNFLHTCNVLHLQMLRSKRATRASSRVLRGRSKYRYILEFGMFRKQWCTVLSKIGFISGYLLMLLRRFALKYFVQICICQKSNVSCLFFSGSSTYDIYYIMGPCGSNMNKYNYMVGPECAEVTPTH